jgi:hypothetical protein
MQQLTFLDLCSGIGGFRLGLESAGHRCIGYCEYDRFARASYEAMYDTEGEWKADDVTKLKSEDVPYADIWCFGFPCQDISVAGKQRGLVGERSGIYARWKEAEEFITQHGTIVKTPSGYWQQVPQVSIAQTYLKIMNKFCEQFGLTPSARSRIVADTAEDKESDEMELLLIKGGGS